MKLQPLRTPLKIYTRLLLAAAAAALLTFSVIVGADESLKAKARHALEAGRFSEAIPYLEHIGPDQRTEAENIALARSYLRADQHRRAETLAKQILEDAPNHHNNDSALLVLADAYADQGKWAEALPLYFQTCMSKGAPPERWLRVGQVLQILDEPELAEVAFGIYAATAPFDQ